MNTDAHDEPLPGRPVPGSRQAFTDLMDSIRRLSDQDRKNAREQADAAVLGFEAYALGQEYLERRDLDGALRWLRIAADHDVPGAQRLLEDTVLRTALDRQPSEPPSHGTGREARFSSSRTQAGKGLWLHEGPDCSWGASYDYDADQRAAALLSAAREQAEVILAKAHSDARAVAAEAQTALDDAQRNAAQILARAREQIRPPRTPAPAGTGAASHTPADAKPYPVQTDTDRHLALVLVAASSDHRVDSRYPADRYLSDGYGSYRRHDDVPGHLYGALQFLRSLLPSLTSNPGRDPFSSSGWDLLYYAGRGLQESAPTRRYGYSDTYYRPDVEHCKAPLPVVPDSPARTPAATDHWKCSVETLLSTYTPRSGDGRKMWIMVLDSGTSAAAQPTAAPAPQVLPPPSRVEGN